tara:strand:+ start:205 stop:954 length:750 start_codon:yes stop_codon:yes gene_type:complete
LAGDATRGRWRVSHIGPEQGLAVSGGNHLPLPATMNRLLFGAATCALLISCDAFAQGGGQRRRGMNVARMMERYDANKDGKLTKEEVGEGRMWDRLARADKDSDGSITKKEMESLAGGAGGRGAAGGGGRGRGGEATWKFLQEKYDANNDQSISAAEYTRDEATFKRLDKDKDGVLTAKDWASGGERQRGQGGQRQRGQDAGNSRGAAPEAGDVAPDFTLTFVADGKKTVKLSDYKGDKPVALVFGSCT